MGLYIKYGHTVETHKITRLNAGGRGVKKPKKWCHTKMYGSFDGIFCVIYRLCYSYHNVYRMKYKDNQIIPVYIVKFQSRNLFLQRYF